MSWHEESQEGKVQELQEVQPPSTGLNRVVQSVNMDREISTPAIQGHRVEGSKKFMIFKMLHFPSFSSFIL